MSRGLKVFLGLGVTCVLAVATLPWWLGLVARPVLRTWQVSFERYERVGYASFRLLEANYTSASVRITADSVQTATPVLWLSRWLRGAEPVVLVENLVIARASDSAALAAAATPAKNPVTGFASLQRMLRRIHAPLTRWLPRAEVQKGELRGFGPTLTLVRADWRQGTLAVKEFQLLGHSLDASISLPSGDAFLLTAQSSAEPAQLRVTWAETEMKGTGSLWEQPLQLSAQFAPQGWLPLAASAVAENWQLPASRVRLGAPYAQVQGGAQFTWSDNAFSVSARAQAVPDADTKAPAFTAEAAAQGNLREVTLTALHLDAPFATARLTAPLAFSFDHPPANVPAELRLKADLSKLPWITARGQVEGSIRVTADAGAISQQNFALEFTDVQVESYPVKKARMRGALTWPKLELQTLDVQLDDDSTLQAHGAVNWQTRALTDIVLQATLTPSWLAPFLPKAFTFATGELKFTASGPWSAPQHAGSLKLAQATWAPLQPTAFELNWRGTGRSAEILSARALAGDSSLALAGELTPLGLQLTRFEFAPDGQVAWQLVAPAQLSWSPTLLVDHLQLNGASSQFAFDLADDSKATATRSTGKFALSLTAFDSAWLRDWLPLGGPRWQVSSLRASGQVAEQVLNFETALNAQIAMQPKPAEIRLVARGDETGIRLEELTVVESGRVLTQATGRLPVVVKMAPALRLTLDETAPLELTASTDPMSPLWAAISDSTGLQLVQPDAQINLKGTLRQPAGELTARVAKLSSNFQSPSFSLPEISDLTLALKFERGFVALNTLVAQLDGQQVSAHGRVPMDDARWTQLWREPAAFDWSSAQGEIEIPGADLAILARRVPNFVAPKGRLQAKITLTPGRQFAGILELTDAASRPMSPFGTLQEVNARLALDGDKLTIENLTAKLGGEPVTLDGHVIFAAGSAPKLALGLKGKNLPLVRNTGLLLRSDIDLQANTDDAGVTRVSGRVTLRDSLVLANLGALLPTGQRGVTRQPPYFAVEAEPFRHWPLAVAVEGEQSVRIRTAVLNGLASAHFQLDGTLGEPRAVGELTLDQGQVLFPFATFTILNGNVRLRQSDPYHAVVNLTATSQRRDYQLRLEATGQLPSPAVTLSSSPSLEAEEVLLMVMAGQAPTGQANTSSGGQRLALLGAYLGRGLFQDLGVGGESRLEISSGEHISRQGRETYDFEYKLNETWSLLGEYDQFDSYNAGVKWRVYTQESKPVEKK